MRVTVDDGVELAVEVLGDGPPFVMIHGFTGAKEDFADDAPRLAEHHRVVLFDHRGHGESDKPDDAAAYSLDRLAADTLGGRRRGRRRSLPVARAFDGRDGRGADRRAAPRARRGPGDDGHVARTATRHRSRPGRPRRRVRADRRDGGAAHAPRRGEPAELGGRPARARRASRLRGVQRSQVGGRSGDRLRDAACATSSTSRGDSTRWPRSPARRS